LVRASAHLDAREPQDSAEGFFERVSTFLTLLVDRNFGISFILILANHDFGTKYQSSFWLIPRYWNKFKSAKDAASTQRVGYRLSSNADPCTQRNPARKRLKETRRRVRIELRGPEESGNRVITSS
jgi:hypothetical protein